MVRFLGARQILYLFLLLTAWAIPSSGSAQTFPPISVVISDSAATQGYYFMSPYKNIQPINYDRPLFILDRYGRVVFYRYFAGPMNENGTSDFKIQPDKRMSYCNISLKKFFLMDSTFVVSDSIDCVNGFETDMHDFQILPNHHYLMIGKETRTMNLSSYHWFGPNHTAPGGVNAEVTGVVIQEFDENKTLVWEWKGHDHYQFGDVDQVWLSLPNKVDWTHANAIEQDKDGNILLSLRHFDEITKINHSTGDIIWRMGGKANQFTFPNDPIGFTGQHDIRRVSDTSVSLFDNGQYTNPVMARAMEYALDENNKIARKVWEYIYDSSLYSTACGNHQYLENGNHLVDFGSFGTGNPWMVVVKPDKTKVMEISLPDFYFSYRAFNYITLPWQLHRPAVDCEKTGDVYYLVAEPGHPQYKWSTGATTASIPITSPGDYWVYVPYGDGTICSEYIHITDVLNPCLNTTVQPHGIPAEVSLSCMPNPAIDKIRIVIGLPSASEVSVSLQSLQGVEISRPLQGSYTAGQHEVTLDVSSFSKGICFLTLTTAECRIVRKIVLQ